MTREEEIKLYLKERNIPFNSLEANSIIEGAEWADSNPPKGTSLIKWQTGEPKKRGAFLTTYQLDETTNVTTFLFYNGSIWVNGDFQEINESKIIAWFKLSDVEPYK